MVVSPDPGSHQYFGAQQLHQISSQHMPVAGNQLSPGHIVQPYNATSQAENIQKILTCGQINVEDLQHVELIGSGNGGQVYK